MMIIKVNNQVLDLPEDAIRYERPNDIVEFDFNQGDFSFPYTIPATPTNQKALRFLNNMHASERNYKLDCIIEYPGLLCYKASLLVNKFTGKNYDINIVAGIKSLTLSDTKLKDLDLGGIITLPSDIIDLQDQIRDLNEAEDWTVYPYAFPPFHCNDFYNGGNVSFNGIVNRVNAETNRVLANLPLNGSWNALVPWFYLFWILDIIATSEKVELKGTFIEDPEMATLLMFNNYALDEASIPNRLLARVETTENHIPNQKLKFKKGIPNTEDTFGNWSNTLFEYTVSSAGEYSIEVELIFMGYLASDLPEFNLKIDGNTVAWKTGHGASPGEHPAVCNISYTFTATPGDVGKKIIVDFNWRYTSGPFPTQPLKIYRDSFISIINTSYDNLNVFSRTIDPKNHMPDLKVSELLTRLKTTYGLKFNIDKSAGVFEINYTENILKKTIGKDLTAFVSPEYEVNINTTEKDGFTIHYDFNNSEEIPDYDESKIVGSFKTKFEFPAANKSGDLVVEEATNRLYIAKHNGTVLAWSHFGHAYKNFVIGNGEKDIALGFSPMLMTYSTNADAGSGTIEGLMPLFNGSGSSNMFGLGINSFEPMLIFNRGINKKYVSSNRGGIYLLASSGIYGINHNKVGNCDLKITGDRGIYATKYASLINLLTKPEMMERDIYLNAAELLNLKLDDPVFIHYVKYIITNLSFPINKNIGLGRITLIKS